MTKIYLPTTFPCIVFDDYLKQIVSSKTLTVDQQIDWICFADEYNSDILFQLLQDACTF